ncbi:DUF5041 domain-containing protein [Ancylomarina euxinus]|uniref:DUF5041 domain-containing protein n=1 Tax=Ancylomarina euxinus TaxID=2283627 RepID=A0A425XXS0_9BACT|nr:DUF5041 domain-containing protein [Ancylomarina euxinus]MCZ4696028.1 DUF5041 domain-containing protein [Ancylomarina euxinus]MUP13967.1 DUF5041 domain-containing protein [Ancylomarina euxinus]RRG19521.1 DUF5041 domain-containing protein [Ancylomarina euxinus]
MKKTLLIFCFISIFAIGTMSQVYEPDRRSQLERNDDYCEYMPEKLTKLDLIQALEVAGVRINIFDLGDFDKTYKLTISLDEYVDSKRLTTDIIFRGDNETTYYKENDERYFIDYIKQIKIFSKESDESLLLHIKTLSYDLKRKITFKLKNEEQYYSLKAYANTKWELNKKIPLLVYASSWERDGSEIICGSLLLEENEKGTDRILSSSPHYFIVSYEVREINNN